MPDSAPIPPAGPKIVETFVSVVQRRTLQIEARLLPLIEPLFLIETHMTFEERLALFEVALGMPGGFVACEVGSYLGASSSFLAAAAVIRDGHVHCVDTWHNDAMREAVQDAFPRFCENTRPFRYLISPHRGRAVDRAPTIPNDLHLLFIDGDHSFEGVTSDLTHYVPKLRPGGVLALHDFDRDSVRRACADYFAGSPPVDRGRVHNLQVYQVVGRPGN